MNFPIVIQQTDARYLAKLLGENNVQAGGATQQEAIAALTEEIQIRIERGELSVIDLPDRIAAHGVLAIAGKYADDPLLKDICGDIYAARDREEREQ